MAQPLDYFECWVPHPSPVLGRVGFDAVCGKSISRQGLAFSPRLKIPSRAHFGRLHQYLCNVENLIKLRRLRGPFGAFTSFICSGQARNRAARRNRGPQNAPFSRSGMEESRASQTDFQTAGAHKQWKSSVKTLCTSNFP